MVCVLLYTKETLYYFIFKITVLQGFRLKDYFLISLHFLKLCGPVKSWKRAQDPTDGTPKGFGFCEFESAEGVLRALRLLSKFNIDGQELVVCGFPPFLFLGQIPF